MTDNYKELEPIPHFVMTDYVRVPIIRSNNNLTVILSKTHRKFYSLDEAPDFIVSKIVIADALENSTEEDIYHLDIPSILSCPEDSGDPDNAWKASKNLYILVIHVNDFYYMQGEYIGYPREKSKRQSKKDS